MSQEDRYRQLHLRAALKRRCDYAHACKELTLILRSEYLKSSKSVQRAIYDDILTAVHLIPGMVTEQQTVATRELLAVVKTVLPKKRKTVVMTTFKQASVAQSREGRSKENNELSLRYDFSQLSTDALLHIFSFLDPLTLTTSSAVCRTWHDTANEESLWQAHYKSFFDDYDFVLKRSSTGNIKFGDSYVDLFQVEYGHGLWRSTFVRNIKKQAPRKRGLNPTNRVSCNGCKTLYWLSETSQEQAKSEFCVHNRYGTRPANVSEVVRSLRSERHSSSSSSDSESESDGEKMFAPQGRRFNRLWATRLHSGS